MPDRNGCGTARYGAIQFHVNEAFDIPVRGGLIAGRKTTTRGTPPGQVRPKSSAMRTDLPMTVQRL
jgi:hypothetical protein